jgi:membrane protease YdiL (CAAX protease family)
MATLVAANVMNNRIARRWAPVTSAIATAALLAIARRGGLTHPELGFERSHRGMVIGGCLAAGVAAVYGAGITLPRTRPLFRDERALSLSRGRFLEEALVQVPVGTVLLEEVAFRGVLPALLGRSMPSSTATAVSSGLFGLWHVLPALDMAKANPALSRLASGDDIQDFEGIVDRADGAGSGGATPTGDNRVDVARLVAGTVVSTAAAGVLFNELRRHGGLLAPCLLHVATNSFGYVAARMARRIDQRSDLLLPG